MIVKIPLAPDLVLRETPIPPGISRASHIGRAIGLDGSGYPLGLSGEGILLEAKVIGVADVVEAIASHSPYRPALSIDDALEEIRIKSNILYDREVVTACLKLFSEEQLLLN